MQSYTNSISRVKRPLFSTKGIEFWRIGDVLHYYFSYFTARAQRWLFWSFR